MKNYTAANKPVWFLPTSSEFAEMDSKYIKHYGSDHILLNFCAEIILL